MVKKLGLNKEDGLKVLKGLCIALGGATLVYMAEILPQIDFGTWTPLVTALAAVLVNYGRKKLKR